MSANQLDKETEVRISRTAANMVGTTANLCFGDQIKLIDLLYGLMLPSGNDAAFAIAEYFGKIILMESEEYKQRIMENPEAVNNIKSQD
jgi:D-alanyl-D-alanine carboxypeptidase